MFCQKCGAKNEDNAATCVSCNEKMDQTVVMATAAEAAPQPQTQPKTQPQPQIQSYLAFAIIVTVLCCIPFGIPAIVYAAQVPGKVAAGNIEGALDSSKKAKMWCWIAFGAGLAFMIIYTAMTCLPLLLSSAQQH